MAMRIASLLASGTEIAHALGLGPDIVAISHECDYPSELLDRPRVTRARFDPQGLTSGEVDAAVREAMAKDGSVYVIDRELLKQTRPDLVLTQAVCEVCAVPAADARRVVEALDNDAEVLSLDAHTLDDILDSILQVGEAADVAEVARDYVGELRARLERVRERVGEAPRPRVLGLEWLDPPFVPGHWVPEMIEIAGGIDLVGRAGARSSQETWEALTGLDPDALIVMPCGFGLEAARGDADRHAERLRTVAPRAIRERRAHVVDASSYFNRSGPRVVDGVEILAALLHPERFGYHALTDRADRWTPPG